jgi:hypothetical protein
VRIPEISSDPRQPSLFEKRKNIIAPACKWIEQVISSVDGHFSAVASSNQRGLGHVVAAKPENPSVGTMLLYNNGAERLMKARLPAAIAVPNAGGNLALRQRRSQRHRVPHVALFAAGVVIQAETGGEALGARACRARRIDTCRDCLHPPRTVAIGL